MTLKINNTEISPHLDANYQITDQVLVKVAANPSTGELWLMPVLCAGPHKVPTVTVKERVILFDGHTDPVVLVDAPRTGVAMQASGMFRVKVDLSGRISEWPQNMPFTSTPYAPASPNQTGGHWPYMGIRHKLEGDVALWRQLLYPIASMGATVLKGDGSWMDQTKSDLALDYHGSRWRNSTKTDAPISYTDPTRPYLDRAASDQNGMEFVGADAEHLTVYSAVCEAARKWPDDQGFQMLAEQIARRLTFMFGPPVGWSDPGPVRGWARPLLVLDDLRQALPEGSLKKQCEQIMAERLFVRVADHWKKQIYSGKLPFTEAKGGIAPQEVGIFFWSLEAVQAALLEHLSERQISEQVPELRFMIDYCARFIGPRCNWSSERLRVPYRTDQLGNIIGDLSNSGIHFVWAALRHYADLTSNGKLLVKLLEEAENIDSRFLPE